MTPLDSTSTAGAGGARDEARVGLYVHVPFCAVRCSYCDFSTGALSTAAVDAYFAGMEREVERRAPLADGVAFTSVFFGGGTPSALSSRHFERLWSLLTSHFTIERGAEITLEANPETVKPSLLETWRRAGVNRLSMGAQSFVPEELRTLARIHDERRPAEALALARVHGFERLSLDLMFAFPGNTPAHLDRTLDRALELAPEHLSAYCFIPEEGTRLGDAALAGDAALPTPDEQAQLYAQLTARLVRAGYACYETSNFAKPGAEARHNLVYWLRRDALGLGPSAHTLWRGERWGNHYALPHWAAALAAGGSGEAERESATAEQLADEIVMLGLRLEGGVRRADYTAGDWEGTLQRYRVAFEAGLACGRLERTADGVRIPPRFRFVADDTIAWLAARSGRGAVDAVGMRSLTSTSSCPIPLSPAA